MTLAQRPRQIRLGAWKNPLICAVLDGHAGHDGDDFIQKLKAVFTNIPQKMGVF